MEHHIKSLVPNRYVIYKMNNNFYEGRISSVEKENNKNVYNVVSFIDFEMIKIIENDFIVPLNLEYKKKYHISYFGDNLCKIRFPVLLKNRLRVDKDFSKYNSKKFPFKLNIEKILKEFILFFQKNCFLYEYNEIQEIYIGFKELFNISLPCFLLYENEEKKIIEKKDYTIEYGPLHLLRLLYFIQKRGIHFESDEDTKFIIWDYVLYLTDFLHYKYDEFFI